MALTPTVARVGDVYKIPVGDQFKCFGAITFTAADVYATGGFDIEDKLKQAFGVAEIVGMRFFGPLSDGGVSTGSAIADYIPASSSSTNGKIVLYLLGRTSGAPGVPQASAVEVANGASIDEGQLDFVAIARGQGTSSNSGTYI